MVNSICDTVGCEEKTNQVLSGMGELSADGDGSKVRGDGCSSLSAMVQSTGGLHLRWMGATRETAVLVRKEDMVRKQELVETLLGWGMRLMHKP